MSFARRAFQARRLLVSSLRQVQPTQPSWNLVARRGYASGHGEKGSSDIPWAIGSIAITVPVAGYLWLNGTGPEDHAAAHVGHNDDPGSRKETHDTEEEEKGTEGSRSGEATRQGEVVKEKAKKVSPNSSEDDAGHDDISDETENSKTEQKSKRTSESDSDADDAGKDTPETSDDEEPTEKEGSEAVGGKPYASLQPDKINNQGAQGYKENVGQTPGEGPKAASGAIHRARNHDDKTLSKKSEGLHDTARLSEPVDPFRKQK